MAEKSPRTVRPRVPGGSAAADGPQADQNDISYARLWARTETREGNLEWPEARVIEEAVTASGPCGAASKQLTVRNCSLAEQSCGASACVPEAAV